MQGDNTEDAREQEEQNTASELDEQELDAAASEEETQDDDDSSFELDANMLLSDDDEEPSPGAAPQESHEVRMARLEAENRVLRELQQRGAGPEATQAEPQGPDLSARVTELTEEVNRMQRDLPEADPNDGEAMARRYIKQQEILDKRLELAEAKDQLRDIRTQNYETTAAITNYKNRVRKSDENFKDPIFEQAFDRFVETEIPSHLRSDPRILDLARARVGYRYLQKKGSRKSSKKLDDGVEHRVASGGGGKRQQKAPKLSEGDKIAADIYGLDPSDFDGRFGNADQKDFDLGDVKYSHVRRER